MGLNPGAVFWMYMPFFTLISCKHCIVCWKRPKINKKRLELVHFFKKKTNFKPKLWKKLLIEIVVVATSHVKIVRSFHPTSDPDLTLTDLWRNLEPKVLGLSNVKERRTSYFLLNQYISQKIAVRSWEVMVGDHKRPMSIVNVCYGQCDQIGRFFAVFCKHSKQLAAIILPKLPTFLGNFCKGVKSIHYSSEIIFGQLF